MSADLHSASDPVIASEPPRAADTMYHDLLSPEEIRDVRRKMRLIAGTSVSPLARRISRGDERVDGFPRDAFDALATQGVFRIPFAADVGGDGLTHPATATAVAVEELAYFSNSVAAIFDVHCILAGNAVNQGTEAQRPTMAGPYRGR